MTMPHLENCSHRGDGWCGDCVKKLGEECISLQLQLHAIHCDKIKAFKQRLVDLAVSPNITECYPDLIELGVLLQHDVIVDEDGTLRWKPNKLINHLICRVPIQNDRFELRGQICLNNLRMDFCRNEFDIYEYMKFYMDMGYSWGGFAEVFGQCEASDWKLLGALTPDKSSDEYTQTPIEYVLAHYTGK
jgi:hypothetical protein